MLCVTVAPVSRTLAKVDLLNAAARGDVVELALDRLVHPPDVADLIDGLSVPVVVSCRSETEGGSYRHAETERVGLLRQAVIAEPDYIELSYETAREVRRFGATKRIVTFHRDRNDTTEPEELERAARDVNADVVKLIADCPTIEAGLGILRTLQKLKLPTVLLPVGAAAVPISLLAWRLGTPWVYVTLEPRMAIFEGQPTVFEMDDVHHFRNVDRETRFVGIFGDPSETDEIATVMNAEFEAIGRPVRGLPLITRKPSKLLDLLARLPVPAIFFAPAHANRLGDLLAGAEGNRKAADLGPTGFANLLVRQSDRWAPYDLLWRGLLKTLEATLAGDDSETSPLAKRQVLVLGCGPLAKSACYGLSRRDPILAISAPDETATGTLAREFGCRAVAFPSIYDQLSEIVVLADPDLEVGQRAGQVRPAMFREGRTVVDLCHLVGESETLREAEDRRCRTVPPRDILRAAIAGLVKSLS